MQARKQYRQIIKQKKSSFKREKAHKLQTCIKNSKVFWGEIWSSLGKRQNKVSDKISTEEWSQHFKSVFRMSESHVDLAGSHNDGDDTMPNELNVPITDKEVLVHVVMIMSQRKC